MNCHYDGEACFDALKAMGVAEDFCRANVVKYLWRLGRKGRAVEDLVKAMWYLGRLREILLEDRSESRS